MPYVFGEVFMAEGGVEEATAAAVAFGLIGLGHKVQKLIEAQADRELVEHRAPFSASFERLDNIGF